MARKRRLSTDDMQNLIKVLKAGGRRPDGTFDGGARNHWIAPLVHLALETAMRQGELLKLTWRDVDLNVRTARGAEAGKRVKFMTSPFSLMFSGDVAALIATVKDTGIRAGVIVLDTLNAATPGMDENASADMGKAIAATKRIREECGGLVILVHHSGKDATKGLRGHSSLHAALDTVIEVTRDGDRRCWKMSKAKDGRDGDEHQFQLDTH
jgi:integrase